MESGKQIFERFTKREKEDLTQGRWIAGTMLVMGAAIVWKFPPIGGLFLAAGTLVLITNQAARRAARKELGKIPDMEQFYDGLRLACEKWGIDIVGGDTTSSYTGLAISITCIGEARKDDIVYRSGAKPTDLVCVSGDLGAAYMGLQLLEREKSVYYGQIDDLRKKIAQAKSAGDDARVKALNAQLSSLSSFQPDFTGKEYLLQRQLQTEARGDIIQRLREAGIRPTAMMDVSDGLSSELRHICKQSGVGCRIFEKELPIDYQTAVMAEEMNMNVTTCALNGGEDYELVFTVPIGDLDKVRDLDDVHLIGHITEAKFGHILVTRDGQEFELKAQGWKPLSGERKAE